jgi:hypothetical protein
MAFSSAPLNKSSASGKIAKLHSKPKKPLTPLQIANTIIPSQDYVKTTVDVTNT